MILDFVQFINDNCTLSGPQKMALLDDFCEYFDYGEGEDEPSMTKKDFANEKITQLIAGRINAQRRRRAEEAVEWEDLVLEQG